MRFLVVVLLLISTVSFAQKKKGKKEAEPAPTQQPAPVQPKPQEAAPAPDTTQLSASMILTEHYLKKYNAASRWNDAEVAKSALYDVIVENPEIDSLIYSLAYFYYQDQKYASSLLISQDLLGRDPKNALYLEMAGSSAQQIGVNDKALQYYESLYLLNSNIRTLYQVAFLQFQTKRTAECKTNIDIIMAKPEVNTEKVVFDDAKGVPKEYIMKVSILNLKGLLALELGDKAAAKKAFTDALSIAPDFAMAKANLEKTK